MILDTFVGADAHIGPRSAHRFYENLRRIRWFPTGRCGHRPLQGAVHEQDWPSISEMSRNEICCCLSATACSTFVGTESYRNGCNPAPEEGVQAAERPKTRAAARNITRLQAPLFAYFFWQDRKSRSAKQRLRCHCKRGSPVNTEKGPTESSAPAGCMDKNACGAEAAAGVGVVSLSGCELRM